MKKFCIISFLVFINIKFAFAATLQVLNANNENEFNQIKNSLQTQKEVRGNFKQIRVIKLLSKPLVSTGTFELSQTKGLTWNQQQPFPSLLIVTDNEISQKIGNNPPTVLTKSEQPIVFAFTHIFLSLFQGDIDLVKSYFTISFTGNKNNWQIQLKPNQSPLDKAIHLIDLSGGKYLSKIKIDQAQGNEMTIYLSNIKEF